MKNKKPDRNLAGQLIAKHKREHSENIQSTNSKELFVVVLSLDTLVVFLHQTPPS